MKLHDLHAVVLIGLDASRSNGGRDEGDRAAVAPPDALGEAYPFEMRKLDIEKLPSRLTIGARLRGEAGPA